MDLKNKILSKEADVGVIGLGYVGLPLIIEFVRAGFEVTGFDIDKSKVDSLKAGRSYIKHISEESIKGILPKFEPTTEFSKLSDMGAVVICVPTPLNGEPRTPCPLLHAPVLNSEPRALPLGY